MNILGFSAHPMFSLSVGDLQAWPVEAAGALWASMLPCVPTHLLMLCLEQGDLFLHLADVARGLGHLGPL